MAANSFLLFGWQTAAVQFGNLVNYSYFHAHVHNAFRRAKHDTDSALFN
jgi:hypothetical protein